MHVLKYGCTSKYVVCAPGVRGWRGESWCGGLEVEEDQGSVRVSPEERR